MYRWMDGWMDGGERFWKASYLCHEAVHMSAECLSRWSISYGVCKVCVRANRSVSYSWYRGPSFEKLFFTCHHGWRHRSQRLPAWPRWPIHMPLCSRRTIRNPKQLSPNCCYYYCRMNKNESSQYASGVELQGHSCMSEHSQRRLTPEPTDKVISYEYITYTGPCRP